MKPFVILALSATLLVAACDRPPQPKTDAPSATGSAAGSGPSAPTTPAPQATPSMSEKKDGSNPVQGQVDPKASEQHKDFQQKGDSAGPKSAETAPKSN